MFRDAKKMFDINKIGNPFCDGITVLLFNPGRPLKGHAAERYCPAEPKPLNTDDNQPVEDLLEYLSRPDTVMETSDWKHSMTVSEPNLKMHELYAIFYNSPLVVPKYSIRYADRHSAYDIRIHFKYETSALSTHFFQNLHTVIYRESRNSPRTAFRLGRIDFT